MSASSSGRQHAGIRRRHRRCAARPALSAEHCRSRDGHWCAELTADTTLESDYILFQLWLHPPQDGVWNPATRPLIDKAVRSILDRQLADGGFNIYRQRSVGSQRLGQGVFRAETGRHARRRFAHAPPARAHPGTGRHSGGQQLRQGQPQPVRSLSARILPQRFHRRSCCCRSTSSTRCRRGRAPSWSRSPSCTPPIRARPVPAGFNLEELWLPGVSRAFLDDARSLYLAQLVPGIDRS